MSGLIAQSIRIGWGIISAGGLLALAIFAGSSSRAQETNVTPASDDPVITNMAQFWSLSPAAKTRLQRIRMNLLVYYCDTNWNVYWGQSDGLDSFLPFHGLTKPIRSGQKILVDGWALPVNQEVLWDKTHIEILSESNQIKTISANGRMLSAVELQERLNTAKLQEKFVEVEALVDSVETLGPTQYNLNLMADNSQIQAFLHSNPQETPPSLQGKRVRIRGVYSARLDPFGKLVNVVLWTPGWDQVQVIGSLADAPEFSLPLTSSKEMAAANPNVHVRVAGVVRSQQPGESVTIWDEAGQIQILTKQRQALQLGEHIEAVGYPDCQGYDHSLQGALFRVPTNSFPPPDFPSSKEMKLHLTDQVRALDQESLALHPVVDLAGEVTWADGRTNFIFIQDSSGGIRVMQTRFKNGRRIKPGMLVELEGVASKGEYAPVITNVVAQQVGSLGWPATPLVSFEQAMTGTEDGHVIQMRGYVRKATPEEHWLAVELVTPGGEFIAHVSKADAGEALPGSIVLVSGVCVVIPNSQRQLTGIEIWSVFDGAVRTEQLAPADLFALPRRPMASLRQFSQFNSLTERVGTVGMVTLQVSGRYLYLQDGNNSLFALSHQDEPLHLGDRVEIVGFPGNDSGRFLLREAVFRRLAAGQEPAPVPLKLQQTASEDLDGLLVRTEGSLLDVMSKPGETRLVIQANGHICEAKLDMALPHVEANLLPGSKLAATGVYCIQRDEYGKPMSVLLNLRSTADIRVLAPPPWWNLRRLCFTLAGTVPVILLGLFWAWQTRRKNQLLQRAQVELKTAQAQLEERVEARTRELNEEVEARKRALVRLSEAQERLLLASRQAGMAEVATGILHNVGNILNSINVSASVIGESLQRLRIGNFSKAVDMLREQNGNLGTFLTEDPRGRVLPGYLRQLADNMVQNESSLQSEMKALTKQVDHVKAVVAWQQGHARGSGFYESLNPVELMEDALQINHGAYGRHGIQVVRQYEVQPTIIADRHKILQILINLLSNAKQALAASDTTNKQVTVRIYQPDKDRICFEVSDTGVGIPPENLERIFSLGFTTKQNGHGFGLHSGANNAAEMGGRLFATSEGHGRGSKFVLELPMTPEPELGQAKP